MFEKKKEEKKDTKVAEILKKAANNEPLTAEEWDLYEAEVTK